MSRSWTRYVPIVQGLISLFGGPPSAATALGAVAATSNALHKDSESLTKLAEASAEQIRERLEHESAGLPDADRAAAETRVVALIAESDRQHLLGAALLGPDDFLSALISAGAAYDGFGENGIGYFDRLAFEAYELVRTFAQTPEVLSIATTGAVRMLRTEVEKLPQRPTASEVLQMIDFAVSRELVRRDQLDALTLSALGQIRQKIGSTNSIHLARQEVRDAVRAAVLRAATESSVLLVSGESGTGKSALALSVAQQLQGHRPAALSIAVINLRNLPHTLAELNAALGRPLTACLNDLGAAHRLPLVDGADAALEGGGQLLRDILTCARDSGVGVGLITSDTAHLVVLDAVTAIIGQDPRVVAVPPLTNDEIAEVASAIPHLGNVLRSVPRRSLLRRLVTLDLLTRSGSTPLDQLSEWDVLTLVWDGLARRREQSVAGSPEARERVLLELAQAALDGLPPSAPVDPSTVDALRRDALIAPARIFDQYPHFAHDEVRRYAIAVLLSRANGIASVLSRSAAPRWALSAAQLACQGLLAHTNALGPKASLRSLALEFQALAATYGQRWADVPFEAALELEDSYPHLVDAVVLARGEEGSIPAEQLLRVVQQRHKVDGLLEPKPVTAVVRLLLTTPTPWELSDQAFEVIAGWLQALAVEEAPSGQAERLELRRLLLAYWDEHLKTPDDQCRDVVALPSTPQLGLRSRRWRRPALPFQLTGDHYVQLLALLGADTNAAVERSLREIARNSPWRLAPAVDSPWSGWSLAQYNPELLADLTESYYIDDGEEWSLDGGIRRHQARWTGFGPPFSAPYFGPFMALLRRAPPQRSAETLNKILNHAAKHRCPPDRCLGGEDRGPKTMIELALTGTKRAYWDAPEAWMWYRGTIGGPYPAMSVLQAAERYAEELLNAGIPIGTIIEVFMRGCENLAVPGMIMGLLTRHVEDVGTAIDPFLREPAVWMMELGRAAQEQLGWRASSEGFRNPDRRRWSLRETAAFMMRIATPERRHELGELGKALAEAGRATGLGPQVELWAAHLNENQYQLVRTARTSMSR